MRFEDTCNLFGCGFGISTYASVVCDWCGRAYNEESSEDNYGDESITFTDFAGKEICECCFGEIEEEILRRMKDILPWFARFLTRKRETLELYESMFEKTDSLFQCKD